MFDLRRDKHGWRELGPFSWTVEREDNHGDSSTTTTLTVNRLTRWTAHLALTRGWRTETEEEGS